MKKSIIALMGLFTLVACSEDAYQNADKGIQTGNVDNGYGSNNTTFGTAPTTVYESPYTNNNNYYIPFHFDIQAPVDRITITPFLGPKTAMIHNSIINNQFGCINAPISFPNCYPNLTQYSPSVNAFGTIFPLNFSQGYTIIQDCNSSIPVYPNPACSATVPQLFDYDYINTHNNSIPTPEFTMLAEQCKIYYIHYKFSLFGQTHEGYLRHQVGNDNMRLTDYLNTGEWEEFSDFPQLNNMGSYGAVVLKNISGEGFEELVLAQKDDAIDILNSEITVTDPATSQSYTLRFRNEANRIVIEFIP